MCVVVIQVQGPAAAGSQLLVYLPCMQCDFALHLDMWQRTLWQRVVNNVANVCLFGSLPNSTSICLCAEPYISTVTASLQRGVCLCMVWGVCVLLLHTLELLLHTTKISQTHI